MPTLRDRPRQLEKLKTRDIPDVEICATGKWDPAVGGKWNIDDATLEEIASNFVKLRDIISPPVKLGHDDGQLLLQSDGYPAAGWVDNVRKKGSKLLADLRKVPEKIADIIEAGGYRKVSVEVWKSMSIDGTVYSNVLTGLALLGAELPAISRLDDIVALYASKAAVGIDANSSVHVAVVDAPKRRSRRAALGGELSTDDLRELIDGALREKFGDGISGYEWPWIEELYPEAKLAIVTRDGRHWQVPYALDADNAVSLGTETEVTQTWQPIATTSAGDPGNSAEEANVDKAVTAALGLADGATADQCVAAIGELKAKATKGETIQASQAELAKKVDELTTAAARRDAKDEVDAAIRAAKLAPVEREWAEGYAQKDPAGFKVMVEKRPKLNLAAIGSEGEGEGEGAGDDDVAKFNAKVAEKRKADATLTHAQAQAAVSRENPDLFAAAMGR